MLPAPVDHAFTFRKSERLRSRKLIQDVAKKGRRFSNKPLTVSWLQTEGATPFVAAFAVPKKSFKLATDRNKIKRRMKEAYRKNKNLLLSLKTGQGKQFAMLFIFTGDVALTYAETETKIRKLIEQLAETIQKISG